MLNNKYHCDYKHCDMESGAPCPLAKEHPDWLAPSIFEDEAAKKS